MLNGNKHTDHTPAENADKQENRNATINVDQEQLIL